MQTFLKQSGYVRGRGRQTSSEIGRHRCSVIEERMVKGVYLEGGSVISDRPPGMESAERTSGTSVPPERWENSYEILLDVKCLLN